MHSATAAHTCDDSVDPTGISLSSSGFELSAASRPRSSLRRTPKFGLASAIWGNTVVSGQAKAAVCLRQVLDE